MNKTLLFIDSGFLSKLSQHFGKGKYLKFDYIPFFKFLIGRENMDVEKIFYYTAPPYQSGIPTSDEILRKKGYDSFINKLQKEKLITIKEGRVQRLINSKNKIEFHQKGVDTLMTLDLALIDNKYPQIKTVFLMTSDTDFCPVIKELTKLGISVTLFTYLEKKRDSKFLLSHHLLDCCNTVKYLKNEDFVSFIFKK